MGDLNRPAGHFYIDHAYVDADNNNIILDENPVHIEPRAMHVLWILVHYAGQTVSRDELFKSVWGERVVVEEALTRTISQLRKALNDNQSKRVIQTVPKKGYRLAGEVHWRDKDHKTGETSEQPPPDAEGRSRYWIGGGLLLVMALTVIGLAWLARDTDSAPEAPLSLAMLPMQDTTGTEQGRYLSQGMTIELLDQLAQYPDLQLPPRHSMLNSPDDQTPNEAAEQFDVRFVLSGEIQRLDDVSYGIQMTLYDQHNEELAWSRSFTGPNNKLSGVTKRVLSNLEAQLGFTPSVSSSDSASVDRVDVAAYQHYLRGNYWWMNGSTSEWFYRAQRAFSKALEVEPDFAAAHGSLAYIYARYQFHDNYMPRDQAIPKAEKAIKRALALDPEQVDALNARAIIATLKHNYSEAEQALDKSLRVQSPNAQALYLYSELAIARNQPQQALEYAMQAKRVDPLSPWVNINLGIVHWYLGEYQQALQAVNQAINIDPDYSWSYVWKARILHHQGNIADAVDTLASGMDKDPDSAANSAYLGLLYLELGMTRSAQRWFEHTAELYGDSADARFWKNFVRLVYQEQNPALRLQLLKQLKSLKSGTYNLTAVLTATYAELARNDLGTAALNSLGVSDAATTNWVNVHQIERALGLLRLNTDNTSLSTEVGLMAKKWPGWSLNRGVSARLRLYNDQTETGVRLLKQALETGWLINGWLLLNQPALKSIRQEPHAQALYRQWRQKQQAQRQRLKALNIQD